LPGNGRQGRVRVDEPRVRHPRRAAAPHRHTAPAHL
jgi:hypothetical protein